MLLPAANRRAFVSLVLAQFLGSLADNALLIAAIGLLVERSAPPWTAPALRICFYIAYVLLGPFAGAVADAVAKSRVLVATSFVKLAGCALLLANVHPLLAYALVGLGASPSSPAKYGILPELLPSSELVMGNAWIEVSTVVSILGGVVLGGWLIDPVHRVAQIGTPAQSATAGILVLYALGALAALAIPRGSASNPSAVAHPARLVQAFIVSTAALWRDPMARLAMATTSLFWAVAAALQFLVLRWGTETLGLSLSRAAMLQGALALGIIAGAALSARVVPLGRAPALLPAGLAIGLLVIATLLVQAPLAAACLLAVVGALSGLLLIPMNALLQSRGSSLMHPGQSIAVQNFSESLAALGALLVYGVSTVVHQPLASTIAGCGSLIFGASLVLMLSLRTPDPAIRT
jgi:MFS family permease